MEGVDGGRGSEQKVITHAQTLSQRALNSDSTTSHQNCRSQSIPLIAVRPI
jgi:hypothetical protein